ncbi:FAD-dependent oxidoreductase [Rathayibacter sp. Leaf296]|uniref:FAD-dependent oxidoreductase n=1 Tax=Rathayibacter sp. Leaf296 TaxID=1736327 RepID=UPI00070251B5|nr:hypothetical protein [Rathayibacter sp. Leaf296]KQQ07559.1 hypothetical protein ASF46_18140 [Rathayibacter sp. Leaf296]
MDDIKTDVLVLGQGIGGLLVTAAARAAGLSSTVIERAPTDRRAGVPHASQLHNLLGRGRRELERLLPGITADLPLFDGVRARVSTDTRVVDGGRRALERDLGRELWSIPRMRLEDALRARPETAPDALIPGRAVGLLLTPDGCGGARVDSTGGPRPIRADLVVDAMGGTSPVVAWLRAEGIEVERTVTEVDQWYSTALVRPARALSGFIMVFPSPGSTRGGLASPRADGSYAVSLNGIGAVDRPPVTEAEFRAYARSLPDEGITELLEGALLDRPALFRRPVATWNRHDLAPVAGLVAVGDASGSPNPLHGQGVSGTAWEARLLGRALRSSPSADGFPAHAGRVRSAVWDLMTLHSPLRADVPDAAAWERINDHAEEDPAAQAAVIDVMHLLAPVATLQAISRGEVPVPADSFWE